MNKDLAKVQECVDLSPILTKLKLKLQKELEFHSDGSYQIGVLIIIGIISLVIQIVVACRKDKTARAEMAGYLRDLRSLPKRKTIRLRRQLLILWHENKSTVTSVDSSSENPLLMALYKVSDELDNEDADEIIRVADFSVRQK